MSLGLGRVEPVSELDAAGRPRTWAERFKEFDEKNPQVFEVLRREAVRLKGAGINRWGIKSLYERLRWIHAVRTGSDDFQLNNNYTAFYARKLMDDVPQLEGFFRTRRQSHEGALACSE